MVHRSSLVVRITGWYDWLLIVLVLALGAYTCECLEYGLSTGVQNALLIRAREIGRMFAATGQIPAIQGLPGSGISDPFISVQESGPSAPDLSGKWEGQKVPGGVRRERNALALPTSVVRARVHDSRFLVVATSSTFGNKAYIVEVGAAKKPPKALFRETAIIMLIGLVIGLAIATLGSVFLVKRALIPVQKIALAVQALPATDPNEPSKGSCGIERVATLCVTVNEMAGRLEDSFQIGVGLPAEAFDSPGDRLKTVRGELASMFQSEYLSSALAETLLRLLQETQRLNDVSRSLATSSCEGPGQTRTERLRFYLERLAASGAERVSVLTQKLGADLTSGRRDPANGGYSVQW